MKTARPGAAENAKLARMVRRLNREAANLTPDEQSTLGWYEHANFDEFLTFQAALIYRAWERNFKGEEPQ